MAIIYTYPTVIPEASDILLGTEQDATLRTPTKNFKIDEIAKFIIDSVSGTSLDIPLFFDVTDPVTGLVQTTLVDSIMSQDANPAGTTLTIAGNLSVTGTYDDSTGAVGTAGQILSSTAVGTAWINNASNTGEFPFNANVNPFTITINHLGLQGDYPSVTIVTTGNRVVIGEINYTSTTQLTVTFSKAFSGTVYTN
tara:strand:+ start:11 stop:598 length:588 start_codon:yes stop_codon:yes gene_type:complete